MSGNGTSSSNGGASMNGKSSSTEVKTDPLSSNGLAVDKEALQAMLFKLLDKAGRDIRLTPRVLRKKAEEKMKLPTGGLNDKKETIKRVIMKWWSLQPEAQEKEKEKDKEREKDKEKDKEKSAKSSSSHNAAEKAASGPEHTLSRLTKFAKAAGKGPQFFATYKDMKLEDKIRGMRTR
jgi:hypothetical protein